MNKYLNKSNQNVDKLYNKILFLSRNNFFYTKISLKDTFQNRISLIFLHISFLFVKKKESSSDSTYKNLFQKLFDYIMLPIFKWGLMIVHTILNCL